MRDPNVIVFGATVKVKCAKCVPNVRTILVVSSSTMVSRDCGGPPVNVLGGSTYSLYAQLTKLMLTACKHVESWLALQTLVEVTL